MPRPRIRRQPRDPGPLGSRLLGAPDQPARVLRIRLWVLLLVLLSGTNLVGALVVVALLAVVIPGPNLLTPEYAAISFVLLPAYFVVAIGVGALWSTSSATNALRWVREHRAPSRAEGVAALALPRRFTSILALLWGSAAVTFGIAVYLVDPQAVAKLVFTVLFAGITVCAFSYLFTEFALRPIAARVLAAGIASQRRPYEGLAGRAILTWLLGSAVPVTGLMIIAVFGFRNRVTNNQLLVSILAIGGITLIIGWLLTRLGARRTIDPVQSVIDGMSKIEHGDDDLWHVVVYDDTELGQLQSGFNRMVDGLHERARIQDLFGRHVGREVAAEAMRGHPELGGEEREVAVLFIDLVGSTQLAATHPPQTVVNLLNRFFDVVVEEVEAHRGIVNKFVGDAALAIFGAPLPTPDPAGQALATARSLGRRLAEEVPDCTAAIGVAFGVAVAGNIGARQRFEYTVIGDPVNEAARLCELAKSRPGRLLGSDRAIAGANPDEARHWIVGEPITLRGRIEQTLVATPVDHPTA